MHILNTIEEQNRKPSLGKAGKEDFTKAPD
jgi:hypothetical protein